ncbi:MAG: hypothetical protein M1834_005265 [Cirrosporium novae-zelandiae]|nr:MAG: hypothetical protein M1834_005265 [Cirrosporium novae-zelandiae]
MSSNPSQLFLLADHIKLSLLERQRAISLNLEPNSQDTHISRSLESFREGVEAAEAEQARLAEADDPSASSLLDQTTRLRTQYTALHSQFQGFPPPTATANQITASPNDPVLASDFTRAQSNKPLRSHPSSSIRRTPSIPASKSVRFSDNPLASPPASDSDSEEDPNRAKLFPYRDDPADNDSPPDQSALSNQQIHQYHRQVLAEQDAHLDTLGQSVSRQRELSIQIGDELDDHVAILDDVDQGVERHQSRLDGARRKLGIVARKAKDNGQITIIVILIIILVLLIILLK